MKKLDRDFYSRDTLVVAQELLGKYLVRRLGDCLLIGKIVEVEAYMGEKDKAAHSFGGRRTARNDVMYGEAGHIYVYFNRLCRRSTILSLEILYKRQSICIKTLISC